MRQGRKSAAQTKAPLKDRIKGSKVNKVGSAESTEKAKEIILSDEIISALSKKATEFNEKHKGKKVSVNTLKAVFRRGAGAYSTSHRPNMTRDGWAYARVNKFLEKKAGNEVKKAYIQDDDLLENGGQLGQEVVCVNCGWHWNTTDSDEYDKYVCHKCGFDNSLFYSNDIMAKGGLIAPNGKPSNLTKGQYKLVRTPEFKAWFGDWENDPKNASKVVDENGEPLVVYHGTNNIFNEFLLDKVGQTTDYGMWGKGFYFSPLKSFSKTYGSKLMKVFLSIKNPYLIKNVSALPKEFKPNNDTQEDSEILRDRFIKNGNNGVFQYQISRKSNYIEKEVLTQIVAFYPNQIKLADGTNTTFDMNNLDIRYEKGGKLKPAKSLVQIAKEKGVTMTYAFEQLKNGMKFEREHSDDKKIQKTIALQHLDENIDYYKKLAKMEASFEKGGEVDADNPKIKDEMIHNSGKVGGLLVGKRHSEGGIKAINKSNNSPLEMEGGEVVITRNAVSDDTKREFEGEMLTNREILSRINESGGGVSFAKGGDVPEHIMVSGKEYKYGGKTLKDSDIVDYCGCKHKMADGGTTESMVFKGYEIGDDGTYRKPSIKHFGVKHHELKPSEAFEKIYGHNYKRGGRVESIVLIDKSVPSYNDFKNNNKSINLHITKSEYKKYLKNNYKVDFDHLPNTIRMGLLLGNQKLVDKYINA